jgi:hypothetical protein
MEVYLLERSLKQIPNQRGNDVTTCDTVTEESTSQVFSFFSTSSFIVWIRTQNLCFYKNSITKHARLQEPT